jgi:hypothetical protein
MTLAEAVRAEARHRGRAHLTWEEFRSIVAAAAAYPKLDQRPLEEIARRDAGRADGPRLIVAFGGEWA